MKSISVCIVATAFFATLPMIATADPACNATITVSIQENIGDAFVNANFKSDTQNNYSASIKAGNSKSTKVPCGIYEIAATPVTGVPPENQQPATARKVRATVAVGACNLKEGAQSLTTNGSSVSVTFPNDFHCP